MSIGLLVALVLAVWVAVMAFRGSWSDRLLLVGAVALGLLLPDVVTALTTMTGSAVDSLANLSDLSF